MTVIMYSLYTQVSINKVSEYETNHENLLSNCIKNVSKIKMNQKVLHEAGRLPPQQDSETINK